MSGTFGQHDCPATWLPHDYSTRLPHGFHTPSTQAFSRFHTASFHTNSPEPPQRHAREGCADAPPHALSLEIRLIEIEEAKTRLLDLAVRARERPLSRGEYRHAKALVASLSAQGEKPRELGLSLRQLGLGIRQQSR